MFNPVLAILFYGGVVYSLWRWRDPRHAFLLLWLAASVIPSLVTTDAPSSIRIINLLPVLMLFPMVLIHKTPDLSTLRDKLSTELITRGVTWGLWALLLYSAWSTVTGLWRVWPQNEEVRFVWQAALTEAAAYLDNSPHIGSVAIGGWTPDTMDPPTMALTLRRDDLSFRYFDPLQSLILPGSKVGESIRIVNPGLLPLAPYLQRLVARWEQPMGEFTLYELPGMLEIVPEALLETDFGDELQLIGYDTVSGCGSDEPCTLATYWRVTSAVGGPRRIFLHAVNGQGGIVAQDDRLGAPAEHWQPGDVVIQLLMLAETGDELRLGVYDPRTGQRLPTGEGEEFVVLELDGGR